MRLPLARVLLACLAALSLPPANVLAAGVRQFSPQGVVDQQTRATAQFYSDMAKLGDVSAAAPFGVDCGPVKGSGRWVDARTWAWQLDRPLQAGERCDFRLKPGLKDLAGEEVKGEGYAFFASGPWPRSVLPRPGLAIEEDQAFVLDVSAPLKQGTVEQNVWCEAEGVGNRIPAKLYSGAERNAVLDAVHRGGDTMVVVGCRDLLPAGGRIKLVWGKGVEAANGTRTQRAEEFAYPVQERFTASFSCEREKASAPCSPLSALTLSFSKAVDMKLARAVKLVLPNGSRPPTTPDEKANPRENTAASVSFAGPLPQNAELRIELPAGLKDEAGRPLSNATSFPLKVRTGALPPLAKFPGDFGIVELKEGGLLPVTLRNVEAKLPLRDLHLNSAGHSLADKRLTDDAEVIATMHRLKEFERQTRKLMVGQGKDRHEYTDPYYARELRFLDGANSANISRRELPKPSGTAEFEVVGIPLDKPGYHVVEIESRMLGAALLSTPKPMYVRAAALVTNLAVHLKSGRDNGLVWVTALDSGKPVAGADVRVSDCNGKELWRGKSDAQGRALSDKPFAKTTCRGDSFVFASARLGEDYSFVRSDWTEGIEPWRFGVETWGELNTRRFHTVFDRTLLRLGQTVSMKHIARERDSRGFRIPDAADLPTTLTIRHEASGTEYTQPLRWEAGGSATSQWKIPEAAKRGTYTVTLSGAKSGAVQSGEFQVSDFRLPVFAGSVQGVPNRQIAPKEVPLALGLSFLNGGAAKNQPVQVSATLRPRWPTFEHYANYSFYVDFDREGQGAFNVDEGREHEQLVLDKQALSLDKAGAGKLTVPLKEQVRGPSEVYAEMTFTDPNGEVQTIHGSVELWPAAVVAGIGVKDWAAASGAQGAVDVVVLGSASGKPEVGTEVRVIAKRRVDYSHRRRVVGGFYAYEHHSEFVDLGEVCRGRSDTKGLFHCNVDAREPGSIYLLAEVRDGNGNAVRAGTSFWVAGRGDTWFTAGNQDRIDVLPEKRSYQAGETARLQVRTPFREATALISIEAGGVLDSYVQPLSRFKPVVEIPVKGEWGPNAFVSVLLVRGRVQPPTWYSFFQWGWREPIAWFREWWQPEQPTAMVDLAKPAYRLGLAEIGVGTESFKLKVEASTDKQDYRPRDPVTVKLKVRAPDGKPLPAGSEVAIAAVDQALLELKPNESWNLLEAMLQKRGYEVETATAQGQVIGKRHFGRKAVPAGGGGGRAPARELFDTLLLWNPHLKLDAEGMATVQVPLNDSLSEFRIVAIATAGSGLFGTGDARVRTKQDLQMISGLPPLVREKDQFQALLTLRNGTAKPMQVSVHARLGDKELETREVKLEAEGAAELSWSGTAPENASKLTWEFSAEDKNGSARDRLRITQQVAPAVPVTVQQASFSRIEGRYEIAATQPAGALPGRGGIEVALSPKISAIPPGVTRYFEQYPFGCLEQRSSIAVGLHDPKRWQTVVDSLPAYLDNEGLARYFPGDSVTNNAGSVALTAYLLDISREAGFALPDDARNRMLQGLTRFVEGRLKREPRPYRSPAEDLLANKLTALEALTRAGATTTSASAAAAALAVEPLRLPTSALIDWSLVLRRLADLPQRSTQLAAAERELRNRLSYSGGRLAFSSERSDFWWWMMVSGDYNAFRLIDAVIDEPSWQADLPALVLGAVQRQARGRWFTTTANAWAVIALDKFGRKFEKEPVRGTTKATLVDSVRPERSAQREVEGRALGTNVPSTTTVRPEPFDKAQDRPVEGRAPGQTYTWKGASEEAPRLALAWPTKPADSKLSITHEGPGKPWANIQVLAAVPVTEPRAFGYRITRSVTPLQEKEKGKVTRGDLWRVMLDIEANQDMDWVVVSDPIPAGARILGDGDGRDSHIAQLSEDHRNDRLWPTFVERTFEGLRAYYEVVPRGHFKYEYTVRINNAGEFTLPATRVEAMYAPDVFGEAPNGKVVVGN